MQPFREVAPHAGAWIETILLLLQFANDASRPTRARGLKQRRQRDDTAAIPVAPHAGAWIETPVWIAAQPEPASRPTRARGLKQASAMDRGLPDMSRPTRARGLKQLEREAMFRNPRRAPRGRVD